MADEESLRQMLKAVVAFIELHFAQLGTPIAFPPDATVETKALIIQASMTFGQQGKV